MTRAAIYVRVSTQEQADSRLGLDSQLRLAVETLRREDSQISSGLFSDAGVSGSVPLALRKDGRRLVDAIERGEVSIVVALTQDRLFRSLIDALATLERWDELGVRVLLVDGGFIDMEDDDKWLSTAMRALFAEKERRDARRRTKRALQSARDRGKKLGGVPFGARSLGDGVHEPVVAEQAVIARIRAMRAQQMTFRDIAAVLNREKVPTRRGRKWQGEQVRRIMQRLT